MSARFYYSSLIPPPPLLLYQRVLYYVHYFEYLNFIHNNNSDFKKNNLRKLRHFICFSNKHPMFKKIGIFAFKIIIITIIPNERAK